ncbi:hypothetical protein [Desulfobacula sp.]|nr:hypothetical protein [Desulfobacula sp.]
MYQKNKICEKIKSIFPDVGKCGIDNGNMAIHKPLGKELNK